MRCGNKFKDEYICYVFKKMMRIILSFGIDNSKKIAVLCSMFIFTMVAEAGGGGSGFQGIDGHDECKPVRCEHNGPEIRFPFKLRDEQPDHCSYPGFELSCATINRKKHTVLELPGGVKFFVNQINYTGQQIQVYDPHSCLARQLPNLNISASPFRFHAEKFVSYSFFNCSLGDEKIEYQISCLSTNGYQIFAYMNNTSTTQLSLSSCKKMQSDMSSVPWDIIYDRFNPQQVLYLHWSKPMCTDCEAEGRECVLDKRNSNQTQTKCVNVRKNNRGDRSRKLMITGIILGSLITLLVGSGIYWLLHANKMEKENVIKIEKFLEDYRDLKPTRYSYADIKRITNQFKDKVGQGGYGTVYKGRLSNEVIVAVKILNNLKGRGDEFVNEVGSMGTIHHVNVARLVGFCADGVRRALVYEFLPNGSLDKYIFSVDSHRQSHNSLGWDKLQDIALGIAKGIEYLHQGCDQRIIHLDIKPHNVLLDENFNPKISDFGMAKLCSKEQSAVSITAARGTMGYIAPEVLSRNFGNVSYKSDVYSFGILLLEIVGGKKNMDFKVDNITQVNFSEWTSKFLDKNQYDYGMEISLEEEQSKIIKRKLIIVGLWCIQWYPVDRPSMNKVVRMLEAAGDEDLPMPPNPFSREDSTAGSSIVPRRVAHSSLDIIPESY